ncbi:MAG: hypothetical protein AAF999_14150 [Pseudomonadota bacterium]
MGWQPLIELSVEHDYYAPHMPPVTVQPEDRAGFGRAGLLLRQSGAQVLVLGEDGNHDLPKTVTIDLETQDRDVVTVTQGGSWEYVPQVRLEAGSDQATLDPGARSDVTQAPGRPRLAQLVIVLNPARKRTLKVHFAAMTSHWAYHVIGPGNEDVMIEDSEGEVQFDPMGMVDLPDGTAARVIRSRAALPARARPGQRFSLSRPGPFGPRTLIPVLPAPEPLFATVPGPEGTAPIIQSDVYVSIF